MDKALHIGPAPLFNLFDAAVARLTAALRLRLPVDFVSEKKNAAAAARSARYMRGIIRHSRAISAAI
jgi:hypothetical protein